MLDIWTLIAGTGLLLERSPLRWRSFRQRKTASLKNPDYMGQGSKVFQEAKAICIILQQKGGPYQIAICIQLRAASEPGRGDFFRNIIHYARRDVVLTKHCHKDRFQEWMDNPVFLSFTNALEAFCRCAQASYGLFVST